MSFETISQGPSNASGNNPAAAPNGLSLDQQNNIVASVGSAGTERVLESIFYSAGPGLALTAITTVQTLLSKAFNAYFLNRTGRTLRLMGYMIYSTTGSNVATLTLTLKLGTVTLCTITTDATNTTASTNLPVKFDFLLTVNATGKVGVIACHAKVDANIGTAGAGALTAYADTNTDALDTITIGTNPAVGDTVTVNGTLVTFIVNGGTPAGNQVALGTTTTATATALYTFLAASVDANIVKATYTNPTAGKVLVTSAVAGFMPVVTTSVSAKITFTTNSVDLTAAQTLTLAISASAAVPSAQLEWAAIEVAA
jgi:hypothetical protein